MRYQGAPDVETCPIRVHKNAGTLSAHRLANNLVSDIGIRAFNIAGMGAKICSDVVGIMKNLMTQRVDSTLHIGLSLYEQGCLSRHGQLRVNENSSTDAFACSPEYLQPLRMTVQPEGNSATVNGAGLCCAIKSHDIVTLQPVKDSPSRSLLL